MSTQPEALRLACILERPGYGYHFTPAECAAELRRLHAVNRELLEALKLADLMLSGSNMNHRVVETKVRAAIAKATGGCRMSADHKQQEPVAWQERQAKRMHEGVVTEWTNWYPCRYRTIDEAKAEACDHIPYEWRPLYTTPPQPKQNEFNPDWDAMAVMVEEQQRMAKRIAELEAQQQEPVAWMNSKRDMSYLYGPYHDDDIPLYTSPPAQRTWVGLTDEEKSDLWCESTGRDCVNEDTHVFADAIEAKIKEKNT